MKACVQCGSTTNAFHKTSNGGSRRICTICVATNIHRNDPNYKRVRLCPYCEAEFMKKGRSGGVFCTRFCAQKSNEANTLGLSYEEHKNYVAPLNECKGCGVAFIPNKTYQLYCTLDCYETGRRAKKRGMTFDGYKHFLITPIICLYCQSEFVRTSFQNSGGIEQTCCSQGCRSNANAARAMGITPNEHYERLQERPCLLCGKIHKPNTSSRGKFSSQDFCSKKCKRRARNLMERYNLSVERYLSLLAFQHGLCGICGSDPGDGYLCVDHDHSCCPTDADSRSASCGLCVRGLLCHNCNLGNYGDKLDVLYAAVRYHEGWASLLAEREALK